MWSLPKKRPSETRAGAAEAANEVTASPRTVEEDEPEIDHEPVSPWLYLAGLCATLSGLFAVNFGIEDPNFGLMMYVLATLGYLTSYVMRLKRISSRVLQAPLAVVVVFLVFSVLSNDSGTTWFAPAGLGQDRAKYLQLVFAWLAILQTYILSTNGSVLFACVPCMTMIALVSTQTTEPQVQNVFLLFICAATFMMVHENFLRTRSTRLLSGNSDLDRRMFGAQLLLAAFCFTGALLMAHVVAVPVRSIGQRFFIGGGMSPLGSSSKRSGSSNRDVLVNEREAVQLSQGPVTETDTVLLRVKASRNLYLLGTTFDCYTGSSFENTLGEARAVEMAGANSETEEEKYGSFFESREVGQEPQEHRFVMPDNPLDLTPKQMKGSSVSRQRIFVLGGISRQIYGAAQVRSVSGSFNEVQINNAGNLKTSESKVQVGSSYYVESQVPDDDPDHLRATAKEPIPQAIAQRYLQPMPPGREPSARLAELVRTITAGLKTPYDKAVAIQTYIARNCKYNLKAAPAPTGVDRVEYFVFDGKEGYCDSFGAAMTILCRYAGIPARLASGFISGDLGTDGLYVIKEKNKHIWTQVFFPKVGWVTFDATEGSDDITDRSSKDHGQKLSFWAWITSQGAMPPVILLGIVLSIGYVLKTEWWDKRRLGLRGLLDLANLPLTNLEVVDVYLRACATLASKGCPRRESQTPDEYAIVVVKHFAQTDDLAGPMRTLTDLFTRCRYSQETAAAADVRTAKEAHTALSSSLARRRKPVDRKAASPASA